MTGCVINSKANDWKLLMKSDFNKAGWEKDWIIEGKPELKLESDGFLRVKTIKPNVLWYKHPFKGNVKLEFDAYVKDTSAKPIIFFMACPINDKAFFSNQITSFYGDYAWDRLMGLYSIGILRDLRTDNDKSNFRYLGGNIKDDWRNLTFHAGTPEFKKYWKSQAQYKKSWNEYERESKPSGAADGCTEVGKIYHFTVIKSGNRIQLLVNGKIIHDVKHDSKATKTFFAPPEEGYIGFRNFLKDSEIWIGNIKVYEQSAKSESMLKKPRDLADKITIGVKNRACAAIVSGAEDHDTAILLQKVLEKKYNVKLQILKDEDLDPEKIRQNVIVLGNLASNKFSEYLYRNLYSYEDRYFPGKQGYVVRSLLDPFGSGGNVIVLGGSSTEGVKNAVDYFVKQLKNENGSLYLLPELKVVWGNKPGELNRFPHRTRAGRGPLNAAVKYLRSGEKKYARQYKKELFEYLENPAHLYSYYGTMLWDVMEASGTFSANERLEISNKLLQFLRSKEGIGYLQKGYIKEMSKAFRQPRVIGNHQSRAAMGMYFGWRYFKKYFAKHVPAEELAGYYQAVADIMRVQISSYRSLDEAYSQHGYGGTLDNILVIAMCDSKLMGNYLKSGIGRKMGAYVFSQCSNRGRMPSNGDGGGIPVPTNLFTKLAYLYKDGRYTFMANMAGDSKISTDEPIRGFSIGLKAVPPENYTGAFALAPLEKNLAVEPFEDYTRMLSYDEKQFDAKSFDKLSFRGGLKKDSPYLLVDGIGGFSHAYSDQNSIVEFSQDNFVWLCQPDQFFYSGIGCHNSLTYTMNGIGPMEVPVAAKLLENGNTKSFSYSLSALPEYGEAAWLRHILFFRDKGPFLVLDVLKAHNSGKYRLALNWHVLGEAEFNTGNIKVSQLSRDGKNRGEFSLDYPQNAGIAIKPSEDPKRLKLMKRNVLLNASTRFYSIVQSKNAELGKGESTGLLSMLRSNKNTSLPVSRIIQLSELTYLLDCDGEKFMIAAPGGSGIINLTGVKIKADFALIGNDKLLLVNPAYAQIDKYNFVKTANKGVLEVDIEDPEAGKFIGNMLESLFKQCGKLKSPGKKSLIAGLKKIDPVKRFKLDSPKQIVMLQNIKGQDLTAVGSYNGEVTLLDRKLKFVKSRRIKSKIMSMAAGDLNGDKVPELLVGTEDGWLSCLDADLKLCWQIQIPQQKKIILWYSLGHNQIAALKVAELENKTPMIFAGMGDGTLQAVSADGKMLWNKVLEWGIAHKLETVNRLPDKGKLLAVGIGVISMLARIYYLNASGEIITDMNILSGNGGAISDMVSGNFSSKTVTELLAGTNSGFIGLYKGNSNGRISVEWEHNLDQCITGTVAIPAGKGKSIFIIASENGFVHGFTANGKQLWFKDFQSPVVALTRIPERQLVAAALADGTAVILDITGKLHKKIAIKENIIKLYNIDPHSLLILCDNNLYLTNLPETI